MEFEWEWVQCDKCQKWRGLKPEDFSSVVQNETWFCHQNPDATQARCEIPQILTDSEIDAIYRKRELAKARKLVHPVIWQEIQGNVYTYKRRKSWKEDDIAICQCRPISGKGCLENCINRMLNIECTHGFCPCGATCTNQRFSRRQHAAVEIRRAGMKGFGLFNTQAIPEGEFVTEYMGEIVDEIEYLRRRTFYAENGHKHYYFMQIGNGEVIDACRMGNAGRFMNHSCNPNCETQKWVVKGDLRVGFFAVRNIQAGEELTFNYNFQTEKPIRCCCGSEKCNGTIGGQKSTTEQQQSEETAPEPTKEAELPDPIMLKEEEADDVMRVILARQVGLPEDIHCSVEQIRRRLSRLYRQHGLEALAMSLDADLAGDSGTKMIAPREASSGESSQRQSSSGEGPSRSSLRKRARGKRLFPSGSFSDRRGGKVALVRPRSDQERRRSEVDSSLADITAASGKLYSPSRKNILKVLRLFNLIEIGMNEKERHEAELERERERLKREEMERSGQIYLGTAGRSQPRQQPIYVAGYCMNESTVDEAPPTARQRAQFADLSLLLDVVQHTIDPAARNLFIDCGILSQLQQVVGRNFAPQYSVMLRKILKVVDCLPVRKADFEKTRSAHGTMGDLIIALTHHKDNGVRSMALSIVRQHLLESAPPQKQRPMPPATAERSQSASLTEGSRMGRSVSSSRGSPGESRSRGRLAQASAPLPSPVYRQDFVQGAPYPPPPPPPPPARRERSHEEGSDSVGAEAAGSLSLPPGFGGHGSRERDSELRRRHRSSYSDAHSRDTGRALSPRDTPDAKRKKEIQERILRKLQRPNVTSAEGLYSKESGKLEHVCEISRQEVESKEAQDLEDVRQKRARLMPQGEGNYGELDGWDHLSRDFEDFVRQTLRQRIQKYQQPEHPLRLNASEAEHHFRKLYAAIMESEEHAFKAFACDGRRRHVSKIKLALNIKEFTSKAMHDYYENTRSHS